MGYFVQIANMPEATKLYDTVVTWWDAIEVLIVTGATTAKVEAGNTGIKEHQTHLAADPQRGELPDVYPAHQRRENRSVNTRHSKVIDHVICERAGLSPTTASSAAAAPRARCAR